MTNNEDYYMQLSLPPVPLRPINIKQKYSKYQGSESEKQLRAIISEIDCDDLQDRLKCAMDKIVLDWAERHDVLIDALDELERSRNKLEHRLHIQAQSYEKTLRESQLYKSRYETLWQQRTSSNYVNNNQSSQYNNRRRSILLSSNISCISSKSCLSTSSTRSSSSSMQTSSFSMVDEMIDPILFDGRLQFDNDSEYCNNNNNEFDLYSVLSESDFCTLSNSPDITPVMSPLSSTSLSMNNEKIEPSTSQVTITKQSTLPALIFACGDGFWNTIAQGKKSEVDTLIRYNHSAVL
jgi:hypothetical protein